LRRKAGESDFCASTIAGNAHNVVGFIATRPPFDFETPGLSAPLNPNARQVPYQTVRASLLNFLNRFDFKLVDALFDVIPYIKLHVQSPAPLQDNTLSLSLMDPYFKEAYPDAELSDAWLRLKLWKLHSDLFRDKFAAKGAGFLEVPPESLNSDGFLLPHYVSEISSTHANTKYGMLVVQQIQKVRL
jgi:hypothetical protein